MMAVEDTFIGAKSGLAFLNAYINGAAKVIGMEQALALDTKICEAMGTAQGNMIKEQTGIEEFDAKTAHHLLWNAVEEGFGILSEVIEKGPQRVVFKVGRCPVYEAAQALGIGSRVKHSNLCTNIIR